MKPALSTEPNPTAGAECTRDAGLGRLSPMTPRCSHPPNQGWYQGFHGRRRPPAAGPLSEMDQNRHKQNLNGDRRRTMVFRPAAVITADARQPRRGGCPQPFVIAVGRRRPET